MTQEKKNSFPRFQSPIVYLKSRLVTLTLSNSVMAAWWYAFVVLLFSGISVVVSGKCPCEDPSLCDTISRPPGKEFLMFSTKPNDWRKYDWGKVTTIALFRPWDDELMCEAHKRVSVGAIYLIDCPWSFLNLQKKNRIRNSRKRFIRTKTCRVMFRGIWQAVTSFAWNFPRI